jgi:3-phenylpropionate/trans-cinnamate dioxygenase ferredoxin reductase subunit
MSQNIVFIGAGQATAQCIDTLRRKGSTDSITVIGDEAHLPYQRPPLSKKYFSGALERDRLFIRHASFYAEHHVDLRLGRTATRIDRANRAVHLDAGDPSATTR